MGGCVGRGPSALLFPGAYNSVKMAMWTTIDERKATKKNLTYTKQPKVYGRKKKYKVNGRRGSLSNYQRKETLICATTGEGLLCYQSLANILIGLFLTEFRQPLTH